MLYSQEELSMRDKIIQSQKLFWKLCNITILNKLVSLFNNKPTNSVQTIVTYVSNERRTQGLSENGVRVLSEIYGTSNNNATLFLKILKNGKEFIYLTIHLIPRSFKSKDNGLIHFVKTVYTKNQGKKYALISITQPKPNSLEFAIGDGYTTPDHKDFSIYDQELQKEMNVIITVLNRLFDEDNKEFYVGVKETDKPVSIYNYINNVAQSINIKNQHVTRPNKDSRVFSSGKNFLGHFWSRINKQTLHHRKSKGNPTRKNKVSLLGLQNIPVASV